MITQKRFYRFSESVCCSTNLVDNEHIFCSLLFICKIGEAVANSNRNQFRRWWNQHTILHHVERIYWRIKDNNLVLNAWMAQIYNFGWIDVSEQRPMTKTRFFFYQIWHSNLRYLFSYRSSIQNIGLFEAQTRTCAHSTTHMRAIDSKTKSKQFSGKKKF